MYANVRSDRVIREGAGSDGICRRQGLVADVRNRHLVTMWPIGTLVRDAPSSAISSAARRVRAARPGLRVPYLDIAMAAPWLRRRGSGGRRRAVPRRGTDVERILI